MPNLSHDTHIFPFPLGSCMLYLLLWSIIISTQVQLDPLPAFCVEGLQKILDFGYFDLIIDGKLIKNKKF